MLIAQDVHNAIDIICDRRSQWIKKLPECFVLERSSPYVDIAKGLIAKVQDKVALRGADSTGIIDVLLM